MVTRWTCCLLALLPTTTVGCGGFFCEPARPVIQSGEAIAFGVDGDTVTMQVQILYEGPANSFSWLLPMPVAPDNISVGSDLLFAALFRQTLPQWQLEIIEDANATDTCSEEDLQPDECAMRPMMESYEDGGGAAAGSAVVLESGSVGPFDYVVLQAAENNPSSALEWLNENGYDQPEGSAPLLNYYAVNNHVFVALRLQKEAETGEIQPLILQYSMPAGDATQVSRRAMACVPIQLTRIAATEAMPIQVYIFGQSRAVPLNFVELELDDTHADWLGCLNNPSCFDDDYRVRFDRAANQLVNHSFVTEFAGASSDLLTKTIEIDVTQEEIAAVTSMDEFFQTIQFRLPQLPLVDTITREYGAMDTSEFDASALATELEEKVLKPARDAQAFVDGYPYLTRMYARLSPSSMTKDPFFAFKPELPDVDNIHRATAVPICADGSPSGLTITVDNGGSVVVPATRECGMWIPSEPFVWNASQSSAVQLSSWGFEGDDGVIVTRSADGSFDGDAVISAISFGDSLVMDQTIPEYEYVPPEVSTGPEEGKPGGGGSTGNTDSSAASLALLAWPGFLLAFMTLL